MAKRTNRSTKSQNQYALEEHLASAKKNGSALKVSTARSAGKYPVHIGFQNGTSVVMTACFLIATGFKATAEAATDKVSEALDAVRNPGTKEAKVLDNMIKRFQKEKGREYKNFDKVRALIKSQIRRGGIVSFVAVDESELLPKLAPQLAKVA